MSADFVGAGLSPKSVNFVQTDALTKKGIAVQKYGGLIIPANQKTTDIMLTATIEGATYTANTAINASSNVGADVTLEKR